MMATDYRDGTTDTFRHDEQDFRDFVRREGTEGAEIKHNSASAAPLHESKKKFRVFNHQYTRINTNTHSSSGLP